MKGLDSYVIETYYFPVVRPTLGRRIGFAEYPFFFENHGYSGHVFLVIEFLRPEFILKARAGSQGSDSDRTLSQGRGVQFQVFVQSQLYVGYRLDEFEDAELSIALALPARFHDSADPVEHGPRFTRAVLVVKTGGDVVRKAYRDGVDV